MKVLKQGAMTPCLLYKLIFVFKAQSFLYQQIRIMVGTLLEIGQNNKKPDWIEELFLSKNRSLAGPTMPSKGLILKVPGAWIVVPVVASLRVKPPATPGNPVVPALFVSPHAILEARGNP